jgi:hypothetical protein
LKHSRVKNEWNLIGRIDRSVSFDILKCQEADSLEVQDLLQKACSAVEESFVTLKKHNDKILDERFDLLEIAEQRESKDYLIRLIKHVKEAVSKVIEYGNHLKQVESDCDKQVAYIVEYNRQLIEDSQKI